MANKIIDVVLRMKDQLTGPMNGAMKKLQDNARQYQRLGRQIQRTGRNITAAGKTLTTAITAPAVALGAVAFKEYGEYDKQMRLVQQTMGATEEESKMLGQTIKTAAQDSVYGMQDAADATLNYARAGYSAKQAADMLAPAFNLAAGTATELDTVTAGLSSTIKAFNADTSEAQTYADIFAKAQAQSKTTVEDLFDSMAKASSVFATAKWDVKDLATATGVLGDAYIEGAEAGTALKTGIARLSAPAKQGAAWIDRLGINVTKADGSYKSFAEVQKILHDAFSNLTDVQKTQAASAIFGKNQMAKWLALIQRSPEDISKMISALDEASGTSKDMSDALMSGPGGAIEKLKSNWDIFKNTLGETLAPVLAPMVEKLTEMLQAFSNLTDEQKQNIVKWVAIAAAIGPALMVFGKATTAIGTLIKMLGKFGMSMKKGTGIFKLFAGAGGSGAMLGALGAIGVAIAVVIQNWDKITERISGFYQKVKPMLDKIIPVFKKVFGFISDLISNYAMKSLESFLTVVESIVEVFSGVADFLSGVFTGDWKKIWQGIQDIVAGVFKGLANLVIGTINGIIAGINVLVDGINAVIGGLDKTSGFVKKTYESSPALQKAAEEKGIDWRNAGGGGIGHIPSIPTLASGSKNWRGGLVQISERGGEIVDLPKGSRVYPHDESVRRAYQDGARNVSINIPKLADTITVREDADIDKIAIKLADRLEKVSLNMGGGQISYANQS